VGEPGRNAYNTAQGLEVELLSATLAASGLRVTFQVTDGANAALDMDGVFTQGAVTARFVAGWLDQDNAGKALWYTAYTTRNQTSPITMVSTDQPATDQGGTLTLISWQDGIYEYAFGATVPLDHLDRTHTVGVQATRALDGLQYVSNDTLSFVPNGTPVTVERKLIETNTCITCHGELREHGGSRRDVALCILCHQPQALDPDTGNTVNMSTMIHKIHSGKHLPSVEAGTPYQIIGFNQAVHDYSTVAFPQDITRCETCHTGPQADAWKGKATRAVCTSCHDTTVFVSPAPMGMRLHSAGAFPDDALCFNCHGPNSAVASVVTKHLSPLRSPTAPNIVLDITDVQGAAASAAPSVLFTVTVDGAPRDLTTSALTRVAFTVAGPTVDYQNYFQVIAQGTGAVGTLTHLGAGAHRYDFPGTSTLPANADRTYAVGVEGYLQAGSTAPRYSANNDVFFVAITGATAVPRRTVVTETRCNACHQDLAAHGGSRNDPRYCVLCHIPENTGDERVSRVEGQTVVALSVSFKMMIHKIHRGEDLQQPFILGGFPAPNDANPAGTPVNFGETRFPNDLRRCAACHEGTSFNIPLPEGVLPSREETYTCLEDGAVDPDTLCDLRTVDSTRVIQPVAASCTSCHDSVATQVHVETQTTTTGEACIVCHAAGSAFGLDVVHRLTP